MVVVGDDFAGLSVSLFQVWVVDAPTDLTQLRFRAFSLHEVRVGSISCCLHALFTHLARNSDGLAALIKFLHVFHHTTVLYLSGFDLEVCDVGQLLDILVFNQNVVAVGLKPVGCAVVK